MEKMRRSERQISETEAWQLLASCEYAVLAMVTETGEPYCIPISPVLEGETLYFHCAPEGKKLRAMQQNPEVCLTCIGSTQLLPEIFSTAYESVVARGRAEFITDDAEKMRILLLLCEKYAASNLQNAPEAIARSLARTAIVKIPIREISGKAKRKKAK